MAIQANGQLALITVANYVYGTVGWGNRTGSNIITGSSPINGELNMGYYRNRWYSRNGIPAAQFPSTNLSMNLFYSSSPVDEWNCACDCDCPCGK